MCEINPKQTKILRLEFFTSHPLSKEEFTNIIVEKCLAMEMLANEDGRIRCHIHENEIEEGLRRSLSRISECRGRYSQDPLTHASNVIEDMSSIATQALKGTYPEEE